MFPAARRFNTIILALQIVGAIACPVAAEVTVLANRTSQAVELMLLPAGEPAKNMTIAAGDSRPVFYKRALRVRYREGPMQREYTLDPYSAYFFAMRTDNGLLKLEKIGLGEEGAPQNAPPLPQLKPADSAATIPVKLLVDDDEPTHRQIWEARLRKRVAKASKILERYSGLRLQVVAIETWDSDDAQHDFFQSLREFEREVNPQPARLAIGFSSQYRIAHGRVHMGGTRGPLHPYILLKERSPQVRETERLELLVHELGHYLGASHSPEPHSVMRPVLTGGLQRSVGSRVQFDPVNTLLIAMMGEEVRRRGVRRLSDVSRPTRQRMRRIYGVLRKAMPNDPAAERYLRLLGRSTAPSLVEDTRQVLQAVVRAAKLRHPAQAKRKEAPSGDELTNFYVRQAARAAQQVAPERAGQAMLLALGIFMDDTKTLRTFPATSVFVTRVESQPQRRERLAVLGSPSMRGRRDLAKHFFVSAHCTVALGGQAAQALGLAKEMSDAHGGTGFSFADLAANRAGIVFAEKLLAGQLSLRELARAFSVEDYLPPVADLAEGLGAEQLQARYGQAGGQSLPAELKRIERRILALPAYGRTKPAASLSAP